MDNQNTAQPTTYLVQDGESFDSISQNLGIDLVSLLDVNVHLTLPTGLRLNLPEVQAEVTPDATTDTTPADVTNDTNGEVPADATVTSEEGATDGQSSQEDSAEKKTEDAATPSEDDTSATTTNADTHTPIGEVDPAFNCVPCKGEGLINETTICSTCNGTGKV